jgi:hypothetical protein
MKFVPSGLTWGLNASIRGTEADDEEERGHPMLLIALAALAVLWIGVAAVVAGLCASAASGDRLLARARHASMASEPAGLWRRIA